MQEDQSIRRWMLAGDCTITSHVSFRKGVCLPALAEILNCTFARFPSGHQELQLQPAASSALRSLPRCDMKGQTRTTRPSEHEPLRVSISKEYIIENLQRKIQLLEFEYTIIIPFMSFNFILAGIIIQSQGFKKIIVF